MAKKMKQHSSKGYPFVLKDGFFEFPRGGRGWIKALCVSLSVILMALLLGSGAHQAVEGFVDGKFGKINFVTDESQLSREEADDLQASDGQTMAPDESLPSIGDVLKPPQQTEPTVKDPDAPVDPTDPTGSVTPPPTTKPVVPDAPKGDIINILLIGQDRRPGESRARSDSMILVTVNRTTKTITMTSFMRDSLVEIPGHRSYKLNSAYQTGGMELLNKTLKHNYNVDVDGDIAVDFSQFKQLIDKLGGVDITLTQKEAEHLNLGTNWNLTAGKNRLNGEQALSYSRLRYIDNDYKRAGRQREVLQSLLNRYMSLPTMEMVSMLDFIFPLISTNFQQDELKDLVYEIAPLLATSNYEEAQIPAPGTFKGGELDIGYGRKDWFQYYIDFDYNKEILREIFDAD